MAQPRAIESVEEPDYAAMQITMIRGGIVWAIISAALVILLYGHTWWALAVGVLGLALFPWVRQAAKARRGTVRLDAEGIHKLAPLPWSVAWGDVQSAELTDHEKTVLLTVCPTVPVRHWSRTWRRGVDLPSGCYMATVFPELRNDMERYIAGRLGREAVLVDMPEPATPTNATPAAPSRGPLRVLSRDPATMRVALAWLGAVTVAVAFLAFAMTQNNLWLILVSGFAGLIFAFPLSQALSTRRSDIKIDDEGVHRAGGWGWFFEWDELRAAEVVEHEGSYFLVATPADPDVPPHRSRSTLPEDVAAPNAVIAPVDERALEQVRAHLKNRPVNKRRPR